MSKLNDAQVEQILLELTMPDTNVVAAAEAKVKQLMKNAACVTAFLNQIQGSAHSAARQLAAILLRKKIAGAWKKLTPQHKDQVKQLLLQRMIAEPEKPVQMAIAGVVSVVAKCTVPNGEWNELLEFLLQCSQQADARFRELAMRLFRVLADTIGSSLIQHFDTLYGIFVNGLNDPQSLLVKEESIRALGALYANSESEEQLVKFRNAVPVICQVIEASIQCGHENSSVHGFEFLDDLAECPVPMLDDHIASIVPFAANVLMQDSIPMNVRERACGLITWIVKYQPKKLIQNNLVTQVMGSCVHLIAVSMDEEEDSSESSPQGLALELLDDLLINMPNDIVYEPVIKGALDLVRSADAKHRSAGQLIIFVMAEGCAEPMRNNMLPLLEIVCAGMQDPDKKVRANACSAMSQLSEHLQPEILQHHTVIIPHTITRLDDANESLEVKQRLVSTLDAFCSEMPAEEIAKYVQEIMNRLDALIRVPDRKLQEASIQAIGTVASSSKQAFLPFLGHFITLIKQIMSLKGEEDFPLRSQATRTAGHIALGVGKEHFMPHLNDVLALSLEGFRLESCEIRESSYFLYSYIAELLGAEFVPFLNNIMGFIVNTMESNDGLTQNNLDNDNNEAFGSAGNGFDSEDEDGTEVDEDGEEIDDSKKVQFSIMTGFIDEKMAAVQALSSFLKHCGAGFLPFLEKSLECLEELSAYVHESVRVVALLAYEDVLKFGSEVFPSQPWEQGVNKPLHPQMDELVGKIFPVLITGVGIEFEKQVASVACDVLTRCVKLLGPVVVHESVGPIVQTIFMVLEESCPSQKFSIEDATASAEDLDELLESCGDLISAMAKVCGPSFAEVFQEIYKPMLEAANNGNRQAGVLASIIGAFGDATAELDANVVPFAPEIFPLVFSGLVHESAIVRRSAAYCAGSMFSSGGAALSQFYNDTLSRLQPLFQIPADADYNLQAAKDNATSAIAKMLQADSANLNLSQLFPVVLNNLPLTGDLLENVYVYPALFSLVSNNLPVTLPHMSTLLSVFARVLLSGDSTDETKNEIAVFTKDLFNAHRAQIQPVIESLCPEFSSVLVRCVQ